GPRGGPVMTVAPMSRVWVGPTQRARRFLPTRRPRSLCRRAPIVIALLACLALPVSAGATETVANFTGAGLSEPQELALGPDGALWFSNGAVGGSSIGRITTSGVVSNYT